MKWLAPEISDRMVMLLICGMNTKLINLRAKKWRCAAIGGALRHVRGC